MKKREENFMVNLHTEFTKKENYYLLFFLIPICALVYGVFPFMNHLSYFDRFIIALVISPLIIIECALFETIRNVRKNKKDIGF